MTTSKLTDAQLEKLRNLLLTKQRQLLAKVDHDRAAVLDDKDAFPDPMDAGTHETDESDLLLVDENEQAILEAIEHALAKFDIGSYGLSEESGDPIPYARLEAIPWARYTVAEEEELEKG